MLPVGISKRQRIFDAVNHKNTDLVPWQFDLTQGFEKRLADERQVADADSFLGNHMIRVKYKRNKILEDGDELDLFGVKWMHGDDGGDVGNVSGYPLKEASLEGYVFPPLNKDLCRDALTTLALDEGGRFRVFSLTMNYFERAWSLRGMENILVDMMLNEGFSSTLYERILEHHMLVLDEVLDADFDAVYFGDDWGQQQGLIMGPDLWRKYIKPAMSKMFAKVRAKGKIMILHSCGDLRSIMRDLVDMGLDVYNTVQPEIYDLKELKREYGKDLTFFGAVSTQQFLPYASSDEVYRKSLEVLEMMSKGGGYIFSPTHAVTRDIPIDNIEAMVKAVRDFGVAGE